MCWVVPLVSSFIHAPESFVSVLSSWISSCMCCGTVAPSSLYCHRAHLYLVVIALFLPLLCGFTPAELPFQWVLIHHNRSLIEGAMAVSLQHCLLSRISACATFSDSVTSACRNLQLPCRLIHWNVDFMGLMKIQIYPIVFCWGCARHLDDILILSSIDPEMYVWSLSWSLLGHHVMHPLCDNPTRDNSVLSPKPLLLKIKR
jgi:hypothetical protein